MTNLNYKLKRAASALRTIALLLLAPLCAAGLSGCIVAGVSSSGGAFIWPGGLGLIVVLLIVFLMLRRR